MTAMATTGRGMRILVVDDQREVRVLLREGLAAEGFQVIEASNREELFTYLQEQPIDLITLDLGLGEEDGLALAREIRAARNLPIIMITGRDAPLDRVSGLEQGADDYVTKPFHIREVAIRVRKALERYGLLPPEDVPAAFAAAPPERLAFDNSTLNVRTFELTDLDGRPVHLTETEFGILKLLVTHPGRVFSRDELTQALRGRDWSPLDRTIDGHVARLRRKLEALDSPSRLIRSVRGVGYVFVGEVRSEEEVRSMFAPPRAS
jgi:DNA-binding response OmpR family regulator